MTRSRQQRKNDLKKNRPARQARRTLSGVTRECLRLAEEMRRAKVLESVLQTVTRSAADLTRSWQASLRLLDESGRRLLTGARSGPSVHRRGSTPFRIGEGIIGWVVVNRKSSIINAVKRDPRFVIRSSQLWTPTGIMAVPLLTGKTCIGVLSVSRKDSIRYTQQDLDLLSLVTQLSVPYLEIARLKRINDSDPLTLLHNRRHLQERLPIEIDKANRSGNPLSVAMLDLDHFKNVNDTHGHAVGDEVLCDVAERLRRVSRSSDLMTRWGGEEFFALFPSTNLSHARKIAERIRKTVAEIPFETSNGKLWLTISLGITELTIKDDASTLASRADQALYSAKRRGRNRVITIKGPRKKA